mmetsp:Transcript_9398/g.34876  ORF Transcript_9398/g.34876 Transcript_9398/m.34876 type:complete len:506 (-) Transcript_9398:2017-3534(-)
MVKLNTIKRSTITRDTPLEAAPSHFTPDQRIHSMEKPRELVRAINAAKYKKMFARPFVGHLNGHRDTPHHLAIFGASDTSTGAYVCSASGDGEIRLWDIMEMRLMSLVPNAHNGFVNALDVDSGSSRRLLYSVGQDAHVKVWNLSDWMDQYETQSLTSTSKQHIDSASYIHSKMSFDNQHMTVSDVSSLSKKPVMDTISKNDTNLLYITLAPKQNDAQVRTFATAGDCVKLWDAERCVPKQAFDIDQLDTVLKVKYSPIEQHLLAVTSRDRSVAIYDTRSSSIAQRFKMKMRSNDITFNPYNPFRFSIANDDWNAYTFDIRNIGDGPSIMHTGHTNAVMSVDYSPAGHEFVTAGYDGLIRIFNVDDTNYISRDSYHTQRMRRVHTCRFSHDGLYILSGSDDHGIRVWKTDASAPLRTLRGEEQRKLNYNTALLDRYKNIKQVRSLVDHEHVPRTVKSTLTKLNEHRLAEQKKEKRTNRYNKKLKEEKFDKLKKPDHMKRQFLGKR